MTKNCKRKRRLVQNTSILLGLKPVYITWTKASVSFGRLSLSHLALPQHQHTSFLCPDVLCTYQLHAPGYPPPPGDGGDLTRVGGGGQIYPKSPPGDRRNGQIAPPFYTRRSQCRLASVNVPHPCNPPCGQIPHARAMRSGQNPRGLPGGGGGGLQLIGALSLCICCHCWFDQAAQAVRQLLLTVAPSISIEKYSMSKHELTAINRMSTLQAVGKFLCSNCIMRQVFFDRNEVCLVIRYSKSHSISHTRPSD